MKKFLKVTGIVFAVLVIIALALAFWQRDNIAAFVGAIKNDPEKIAEKIAENDKELKSELETYLGEGFREYTEEEKAQIESGEVSEKEVLAKIISEKSDESQNEIQNESQNAEPVKNETAAPGKKVSTEEIINRYVSKLYSMENRYIAGIDNVLARAHAEYVSIARHEKDMAALSSVGSKYIKEIYALEAQCDGEVETLLANLKAELEGVGADTSIIEKMRSAYKEEKQLKRSYYMKKYL
ncbi:MAG: hypothetical protein E7410_04500 [Ruminococcaceae bacterium]|nr:hypothetical protein [Oscillospiraceae bacterium]